jgi:UTP-glucose-1-phosphate uridylyltransferase
LDVADIVGAAGNPGEYLKSQGNGNAVWQAGKILNNWEEVSTTTFTASIGDRLIVDTTSAVTITLPASASLGDEIVIIDGTGNADSNNITIARNGHNIQSFDSDFTIDISRAVTGLVYYNATQGWILTET